MLSLLTRLVIVAGRDTSGDSIACGANCSEKPAEAIRITRETLNFNENCESARCVGIASFLFLDFSFSRRRAGIVWFPSFGNSPVPGCFSSPQFRRHYDRADQIRQTVYLSFQPVFYVSNEQLLSQICGENIPDHFNFAEQSTADRCMLLLLLHLFSLCSSWTL